MLALRVLLILTSALMWGCGDLVFEGSDPEIVMVPGMSIDAIRGTEKIRITATGERTRIYAWSGCEKEVRLYARRERWYGSKGLYNPGAGLTWWPPCEGVSRTVLSEGQQHFDSIRGAIAWLESKKKSGNYIYRNDGIGVDWEINLERGQLYVDLWQILVNNEKPESLPGADDSRITMSLPKTRSDSIKSALPLPAWARAGESGGRIPSR